MADLFPGLSQNVYIFILCALTVVNHLIKLIFIIYFILKLLADDDLILVLESTVLFLT